VEPTRPRRRSLKSRGSVSSVIVSTASKGSGGGGVGGGMECWRRRRGYHDLHTRVKSHEFHNPRGLGFCGYPSSTRSATGAMAIGMQPSILVNRTQRGMRIMIKTGWMNAGQTVHELGDGKEPQPGNFGPDPSCAKKPHRQSQCQTACASLSRFPGRHPYSTKSLFTFQHRPRKCDDSRAIFIINFASKQRPRPSLLITNLPVGAQSLLDPVNCSSEKLGRVDSLQLAPTLSTLSTIKSRGRKKFIHASLVQGSAETMTQYSLPPIFEELQHPANSATQLSALKVLKNELIGHELRKRTWINHGIIPILSRILSSRRSHSGKRATRESHGNGFQDIRGVLSDDDASCLQAAVILGILAHGRTISLLQNSTT
jgi:hypothetical protein